MYRYSTNLRSITQARGSFEMKFEKYEEVPTEEVTRIIEHSKKNDLVEV
jgi:elongation factor G